MMPSNHLILCHPLLLLPQSFPASRSFLRSQFFISGGQNIGASASASVFPMKIQDWFPLGLTGLISLQGLLQHHSSKASILQRSAFFIGPTLTSIHDYREKPQLWLHGPLSAKWCLFFNMLSRFVIAFHNDFGAQENKACHWFHCFPLYLPWSDGTKCCDLSFLNVEF